MLQISKASMRLLLIWHCTPTMLTLSCSFLTSSQAKTVSESWWGTGWSNSTWTIVASLYSHSISLNSSNTPILRAAHYLQMPVIQDACASYLCRHAETFGSKVRPFIACGFSACQPLAAAVAAWTILCCIMCCLAAVVLLPLTSLCCRVSATGSKPWSSCTCEGPGAL